MKLTEIVLAGMALTDLAQCKDLVHTVGNLPTT
jgi:hypothetical protein